MELEPVEFELLSVESELLSVESELLSVESDELGLVDPFDALLPVLEPSDEVELPVCVELIVWSAVVASLVAEPELAAAIDISKTPKARAAITASTVANAFFGRGRLDGLGITSPRYARAE